MKISEDSVWRYYNSPDPVWSAKCKRCREKIALTHSPVEECINCWKVEIWKHGKAFCRLEEVNFDVLMDSMEILLAAESAEDPASQLITTVIAKASRAPIQVVRTGIPLDGYSDDVVDDLLVLYAKSIAEREALQSLVKEAMGLSDDEAALIPVRRGCWRFDPIIGPWQEWYPIDSDWSESEDNGEEE